MNYRQKMKQAKRKSLLQSELGHFANYKEYKDHIRQLKKQVPFGARWRTECRIIFKK